MSESEHSAEILGPREARELLVDGWTVPFVEAHEQTGGSIMFVVDHRMGFTVGVADFDQVAHLLATAYAVAIGLPCSPRGDLSDDERQRLFAYATVPRTCWPRRMTRIASVNTEDAEPPPSDDPRDEVQPS